jgi:hypothetical protein
VVHEVAGEVNVNRSDLIAIAGVESRLSDLETLRERIVNVCGFDGTTVYFSGYSSENLKHMLSNLRMEKADFDKIVKDILIESVGKQIDAARIALEQAGIVT